MEKVELEKESEFVWKIPKTGSMNVPAVVYASDKLMENIKQDLTLQQIRNVACLKGIQKNAIALPDSHQGYGFNIGGVAAFDMNEGVISPGGVGYDINCGVRMLRTDMTADELLKKKNEIIEELFKEIPAGVGKGGSTKLTKDSLMEALEKGPEWALKEGYGKKEDLERTEEDGRMKDADPSKVSQRAIARGMPQLGTLGAGNHFIELQKVDKIYDEKVAKAFGIEKEGQVTMMIHCGSRGLGHQVASDYIQSMENKFGIEGLPDRELINAPIQSDLGQDYYKAMCCAINYAFANRHLIMHWARESFEKIFGSSDGMDMIYDVCHNIAKFENHEIDGKKTKVCIHRKGATRSFGPGREEIPDVYRNVGQPVIIPGSMGTASYLLVGTKKAEELSFGSTAHGAGRLLSRHAAMRLKRGEQVKKDLEAKGITVKGASMKGLAEEMPEAYKDIDEVVRVSDSLGLAKKVARVVPLEVIKG
jgi:tRNA-splicing ligase RtcB